VSLYNPVVAANRLRPTAGYPLATIIQISDLHFGAKFTNEESWFRQNISSKIPFYPGAFPHSYQRACALANRVKQIVLRRIAARIPTAVAITGDLTQTGAPAEFVIANKYLRSEIQATIRVGLNLGNKDRKEIRPGNVGLFVVPGNHDVWHRKTRDDTNFFRHFSKVKFPTECWIKTSSRPVVLYGLDSTKTTEVEQRLQRGRVLPTEVQALCDAVRRNSQHGPIHVLCLHHPIADPEENVIQHIQKLHGREDIARTLLKAGVHLVLSGHVHRFYARQVIEPEHPNHAVAGTATRQHSECSFSVLDIYLDTMQLTVHEFDDSSAQFLKKKRTFLPVV
jgi:3',5'-cyclic AMP phosphodiesterase CpdA